MFLCNDKARFNMIHWCLKAVVLQTQTHPDPFYLCLFFSFRFALFICLALITHMSFQFLLRSSKIKPNPLRMLVRLNIFLLLIKYSSLCLFLLQIRLRGREAIKSSGYESLLRFSLSIKGSVSIQAWISVRFFQQRTFGNLNSFFKFYHHISCRHEMSSWINWTCTVK